MGRLVVLPCFFTGRKGCVVDRLENSGWEERVWTKEELALLGLIVRMMEVDPELERMEEVFRKGADLVRRLRAGREEEL